MSGTGGARGKGFQKGLGRVFSDLLLLLIAEKPTHGYELTNKLDEFDIQFPAGVGQMGRIYRILSDFEQQGLISFEWDTTTSPPRKIYSITAAGKDYLVDAINWAENHIKKLEMFIERGSKVVK